MFVAVPIDTSDGATELPPHAETHATTKTTSAIRIASSSFLRREIAGEAIVTVLRRRVNSQNRDCRAKHEIGRYTMRTTMRNDKSIVWSRTTETCARAET